MCLLASAGEVDDYLVFGLQDGGANKLRELICMTNAGIRFNFRGKVRQIDIVIDEIKRDGATQQITIYRTIRNWVIGQCHFQDRPSGA